jgi:hypothetical protein
VFTRRLHSHGASPADARASVSSRFPSLLSVRGTRFGRSWYTEAVEQYRNTSLSDPLSVLTCRRGARLRAVVSRSDVNDAWMCSADSIKDSKGRGVGQGIGPAADHHSSKGISTGSWRRCSESLLGLQCRRKPGRWRSREAGPRCHPFSEATRHRACATPTLSSIRRHDARFWTLRSCE